MTLTKKAAKIVFQIGKEHKGEISGSFEIEELKGGVIYKVYHKMITPEKHDPEPEYIKLVFPNKSEIIIPQNVPVKKIEDAFLKSRDVQMVRYEFLSHNYVMLKYLYIFKIGNDYFDLPEKMAKEMVNGTGITLHIYP